MSLHLTNDAPYQIGEVSIGQVLSQLLPSQVKFLSSKSMFSAYIGGEGSGKTIALCTSAILRGAQDDNGMSVIGRATQPALKMTTRKTFLELVPAEWVADWNQSYVGAGRLTLKNGHEFYFLHLDMDDPDVYSHIRSANLSAFYIDEGSEVKEKAFHTLMGRLRRKDAVERVGRVSSNPAGRDWMWETFFKSDRRKYLLDNCEGILAPSTENYHLPSEYIESRLNIYPPDWVERFIHASFADFSDKVYKDWNHTLHVYDATVESRAFEGKLKPPVSWPVIIGCDIGGVDPWAILFIACSPEGQLFVFDEIYQPHILVREIADLYFQKVEGYRVEGLAYDYENQQAALEMHELNIPGAPAVKQVLPGVFKVGQYLHPAKGLNNPFTNQPISPRLFIGSNCTNLVREIATYAWGKDKSGNLTGKPQDGNDHACDALRYAIHTFRPNPVKPKKKEAWDNPALDAMSRQYWYDIAQRKKAQERRQRRPGFCVTRKMLL